MSEFGFDIIVSITGESDLDDTSAQDNKIRMLKREISRRASMANKRLTRLEEQKLTSTPAYQQWVDYKGGVRFGVKGKTYNQLQAELARVNSFLNAKTSTVRGAKKTLTDIASRIGVTGSYQDILANASTFFKLASQVEQYLRATSGTASAIGYQPIWQAINEYLQTSGNDLQTAYENVDDIIPLISQIAELEHSKRIQLDIHNDFMSVFGE